MGKLDGKVAFITGAARGQGRSHAIRLAQEGADIIAVDICAQLDSVVYPMSTSDDLDQTVKEVESLGRRIVAREADVRDVTALQQAFDEGVSELGPVGILVTSAGLFGFSPFTEITPEEFRRVFAGECRDPERLIGKSVLITAPIVAALFIFAMFALIGALVVFLREIFLAVNAPRSAIR